MSETKTGLMSELLPYMKSLNDLDDPESKGIRRAIGTVAVEFTNFMDTLDQCSRVPDRRISELIIEAMESVGNTIGKIHIEISIRNQEMPPIDLPEVAAEKKKELIILEYLRSMMIERKCLPEDYHFECVVGVWYGVGTVNDNAGKICEVIYVEFNLDFEAMPFKIINPAKIPIGNRRDEIRRIYGKKVTSDIAVILGKSTGTIRSDIRKMLADGSLKLC